DKACIAVELAVGLSIIEVRQDRLELLDRLINVDDAARLGEEGGGLDISRQNLPVTIEDVRTRGGGTALRQVDDRLFNHAEMHKTGTNGAIDCKDDTHGHEDAAARTRAAALGRALNGDPARNLLARTELERIQHAHGSTPPVMVGSLAPWLIIRSGAGRKGISRRRCTVMICFGSTNCSPRSSWYVSVSF